MVDRTVIATDRDAINEQREKVVVEARSWLRTPYHHMGRIKGAGVDCATLLAEVYPAALGIPAIELDFYPQEWHLHRGDERYLGVLHDYVHEIEAPLAGDIVVFHIGRAFSHGGIVVEWPIMIHAFLKRGVMLEDVSINSELRGRQMKFFSVWDTP